MATRSRAWKDYYRRLGLGPGATEEEIRRAYRRLALQWHPDRNAGDPASAERFKEISEAYAVLIDAAKRQAYDRAGEAGAPATFSQSREDLFRDLFANASASAVFDDLARELRRLGLRVDARTFQHTLFGGHTVVTGGIFVVTPLMPALVALKLMRAALWGAPGPRAKTREAAPMPEPRGVMGKVLAAGRRAFGLAGPTGRGDDVTYPLRITAEEAMRGGRKRVLLDRGNGRADLLVTIPSGVRAGTRLRLRGEARAISGRAGGDVYLLIEIAD